MAEQVGQCIPSLGRTNLAAAIGIDRRAVTGSGTTVFYAGVDITQTAVSESRIVIDTDAAHVLGAAVPLTLVATSTVDAAQVATVSVLVTN